MFHTLTGDLLQSSFDMRGEGRGDPHVKPAPNKSQPEWLRRLFREFDANPAPDAFTRLKEDASRLHVLLKLPALAPEPIRIRPVNLGVMLQNTIATGTTIAMQTPRRLRAGGKPGDARAAVTRHPLRRTGRLQQLL